MIEIRDENALEITKSNGNRDQHKHSKQSRKAHQKTVRSEHFRPAATALLLRRLYSDRPWEEIARPKAHRAASERMVGSLETIQKRRSRRSLVMSSNGTSGPDRFRVRGDPGKII